MEIKNLYIVVISILALNTAVNSYAKDFALLVGIGNYPDLPSLEGPQYDIEAVSASLEKNYRFSRKNITILQDKEASKASILASLDRIYKLSKAGDNIFLYFSGHGTSYFDLRVKAPLPYTTGAFIPYDIYKDVSSEEITQKLIVGRRDLRPRLSKLDQGGRHVFAAFDTCYSGSSIRGEQVSSSMPVRYFNLFSPEVSSISKKHFARNENKLLITDDDVYPYEDVYYLGATSQYEEALDISGDWLKQYPTIDGKPHGAFTDSLLRILAKPSMADVNYDGIVSYAELKQSISDLMLYRRFKHTPHGLPTLAEDVKGLNNMAVFFLDTESIVNFDTNDNIRISKSLNTTRSTKPNIRQ